MSSVIIDRKVKQMFFAGRIGWVILCGVLVINDWVRGGWGFGSGFVLGIVFWGGLVNGEIELLGKYVETGIRFAAGYWGGMCGFVFWGGLE